ncbi:hypothetical protein M430DRAFT_273766 [Amorphotheca resinae ATCC 22711]|jgi:L-lactate dehydrogenase (cytochrome)|uniref:L-lactate dehydrogenase (cytochrome) n=1 Tax=Amorphotheca resinae ATCC 22711 TaxID=857342 RepID=A0A2T3B8K3_AMORE|nr:hypothetical protein M430DRAFT_273766 [Amorphotheca resinae ATCC 22711]PSS23200.1 hypothetical protein M430DRAFT_273766 [Amorphotheca resinae ATCC 22711]
MDDQVEVPPLSTCINIFDIERVGKSRLNSKALVYYTSTSEDSNSYNLNRSAADLVRFRPRLLRNVSQITTKTSILGHSSTLPFFISPAALAKLGHPSGEICLAEAAGRHGIVYIVSTNSSCTYEEIAGSTVPGQTLFFQLYVNKDHEKTKSLIQRVKKLGFQALVLTIDAPAPGKREADERQKSVLASDLPEATSAATTGADAKGLGDALLGWTDSSLTWQDLKWIKAAASPMKVVLKGIQTYEDAVLAATHGADGIFLSNHGGRQLDHAPSSLHTLYELRKHAPGIFEKVEVLVDGGYRRGTDVLKALCLGATAVGLGRPFMYALSAYGTEGVSKAIELLQDEVITGMKLLGARNVRELVPEMVNASLLAKEVQARL